MYPINFPKGYDKTEAKFRSCEEILIDDIVVDEQLQLRVEFDKDHIENFSDLIKSQGGNTMRIEKQPFEPLVLVKIKVKDEIKLYLVDGFHRLKALKRFDNLKRCRAFVSSDVFEMKDAIIVATKLNSKRGLKYSRDDLKKAIYHLTLSELKRKQIAECLGFVERHIYRLLVEMREEKDKFPLLVYKRTVNEEHDIMSGSCKDDAKPKTVLVTPMEHANEECGTPDEDDLVSRVPDPNVKVMPDGTVKQKSEKDGKFYPQEKPKDQTPKPSQEAQIESNEEPDEYSKSDRGWMKSLVAILKSKPSHINLELTDDSIGITKGGNFLRILWQKSREYLPWRQWNWNDHFQFTDGDQKILIDAKINTIDQLCEIVNGTKKIDNFGEKRIEELKLKFETFWEQNPEIKE